MRYLVFALAAISLISCNRDPNYLKQKYFDSGIKYYDAARYKEANIMFRKSIEADRKFGPPYYRLGLTDLKQNQIALALAAFRRAADLLKPGSPEANDSVLKVSEILIVAAQGQQHDEALVNDVQQYVNGLLKRNPDSWEGHKLTGDLAMLATNKMYRSGDLSNAKKELGIAIAEYRKALSVKPGDPVLTLALGRTLVVSGERDEAETLFRSLVDKDKSNVNGYYELYRVYLAQRKLPEAEAALKTAIVNNPKDTQLRLTLAQYYFGANKRPELAALLNQMKADLKLFPDAYLQSGDFYLRLNAVDDAVKEYEAGMSREPRRKNTYLKHEVEAYVRAGKPNIAREKNDQILKSDPKDPEARGLNAAFLLDKGDINAAMSELQSVVTAKPDNHVARFNLGRAHFARGEYEQARQEFSTVVQLRPDYIPAHLALTQVALLRGDNSAALHEADESLRVAPNNIQAIVMKASALQRLQRFDDARALLSAVLTKIPNQEETLLEMGFLDLNQKKVKEAEDFFHRAYQAQPNNLRGLLGESRALLMEGQPDKAVQIVEVEAGQKPANLDLQRELGNVEDSVGQHDKAIATYLAVLAKVSEPKLQADLWARVGQSYMHKGDVQESINSWEKARVAEPDNPTITTNLGMLYDSQNKRDVARKYYELTIKVDPNNALALNNLAYLLCETNGDLNQALTYAERAKQRLPGHPEVNDTLGCIYLKKKLTANANDTFKTLVVQDPKNALFHYHYAMALLQKGDHETAKKECQSALADKPDKQLENEIHQLMTRLS